MSPRYQKHLQWVFSILLFTSLACATNTPVAMRATLRPTRTKPPTFTLTPVPPTITPVPTDTATPLYTETPTSAPTPVNTDTPVSTDTPAPTDTPLPTNTFVPQPTAVPATDTPEPTVAPAPEANSPLATPTNTAVPGSPPGKYRPKRVEKEANCAHYGVAGVVRDGDDDDDPLMPNVTIQVTGDEDGFRGPYRATTNSNGEYGLVIGELGTVPERVEFRAEIFGPDVNTDNRPEWSISDDCHEDNALQVLRVDWSKIE